MTGIVQQLVLRRAPVDVIVFLGASVKDAGVPAWTELPIERELEVSELFLADQITDRTRLGQYSVGNAPARGKGLILVAAPRIGVGAVEQGAPRSRRTTAHRCTSGNQQRQ